MSASIEVYNPLSAYNSAISKLEKNGIRATKQRRVLAKLIFDKGKRHISAENLFDEVKEIFSWFSELIPEDFWTTLKTKGLLDERAPVPR